MSPSKSIRRYKKHGLPRTDGALTCRITLATGRTINSLNKVASIQSTQYRYDPLGRLLQASHSDGKTETYRYDAPGQLGYLVGPAKPRHPA